MQVCGRCTTHLFDGAVVCTGCGVVLAADDAPLWMPIPAVAAPTQETPANPWRQSAAEAAEAPVAPEPEPVAAPAPPQVPTPVVGVAPPPPGTPIPLTFADPLPPLEPAAPAAEPVAIAVAAPTEPAIGVAPSDDGGTVRGVGQPADGTLAVPAAYADFAAESATLADFAVPDTAAEPAAAEADVVELSFPEVLTVAPPATHVAGWPQSSDAAAEVAVDHAAPAVDHATQAANSRWVGTV